MANIFDQFRFGVKRSNDSPNTQETTSSAVITNKKSKYIDKNSGKKWQERWHAICDGCFEYGKPCEHYPEHRLRLLIVGHNPSIHAWKTGYSYSNPTNRMWMLLTGTLSPHFWEGILPSTAQISEQNILPHIHGVGFTSIGLEPGNDASKYHKSTMEAWRESFFRRLQHHASQVCMSDHKEAIGLHQDHVQQRSCKLPHAPVLIAFSGKRQYCWLFSPPLSKVENYGVQTKFPPGWPHELRADSEIWVLPSSSGRAAMTAQQRMLPYQQLAERLHRIPWCTSE